MRSKALLVSNIFATLYSAVLLCYFGSNIIAAGGTDFINAFITYSELLFKLIGISSAEIVFLYAILVLLCIHIAAFVLGCIIGWIAYKGKSSGGAKFAASLYLLGTICFPVYLVFGLPITIIGFVGGSKQKCINKIQ